jgi:hypothetical protein
MRRHVEIAVARREGDGERRRQAGTIKPEQ